MFGRLVCWATSTLPTTLVSSISWRMGKPPRTSRSCPLNRSWSDGSTITSVMQAWIAELEISRKTSRYCSNLLNVLYSYIWSCSTLINCWIWVTSTPKLNFWIWMCLDINYLLTCLEVNKIWMTSVFSPFVEVYC